jgi:hypothetical protein
MVHRIYVSLKRNQTLFAMLDACIPCDTWGVLTTSDGKVWYIHNNRRRFDRQQAENSHKISARTSRASLHWAHLSSYCG